MRTRLASRNGEGSYTVSFFAILQDAGKIDQNFMSANIWYAQVGNSLWDEFVNLLMKDGECDNPAHRPKITPYWSITWQLMGPGGRHILPPFSVLTVNTADIYRVMDLELAFGINLDAIYLVERLFIDCPSG